MMNRPSQPGAAIATQRTGLERQSAGNGCLGVVVDTTAPEWPAVDETIFAALRHLGLPFQVVDLSRDRLTPERLTQLRGVLLAQARLGPRLSAADALALHDAVAAGLGLVCFDGYLDAYASPLREVLGLAGACPTLTCTAARVTHDRHFITATREAGETLFFTRPVDVARVDAPAFADPQFCLLTTIDNWPAVVARPFGQGRVVVWTLAPQVWTNAYFGHAMGLDDLFWKGIVWAARKPFVMRAMPPFVTFLLDDASSSYNHFRYLDVFNAHGYIPHLDIHIDDVDKVMHDVAGQDSQALRAKHLAGLAEFAAHAFTYNHHIYFDHAGCQPYPDAVVAENVRRANEKFKAWGIPFSRFSNPHFGEVGLNAIAPLRAQGVEFISALLPLGQAWFADKEVRREVELAPYGRGGFVFGALPEYPEFFGVNALVMPRQMTGIPMVASEFLWSHTIFWDEHPAGNDLPGAAQQALAQLRLGLDSLFFGELYTHEQRIAVLSMGELDEILTLIDRGLAKHRFVQRSYEFIADYARSLAGSWLTAVEVDAGGQVSCSVAGRTTLTTSVYLFTETDGTIQQRFVDVPPFDGSTRITH
jgi:hypothetical protein